MEHLGIAIQWKLPTCSLSRHFYSLCSLNQQWTSKLESNLNERRRSNRLVNDSKWFATQFNRVWAILLANRTGRGWMLFTKCCFVSFGKHCLLNYLLEKHDSDRVLRGPNIPNTSEGTFKTLWIEVWPLFFQGVFIKLTHSDVAQPDSLRRVLGFAGTW